MRYLKIILLTVLFLMDGAFLAQAKRPVRGIKANHAYVDLGLPSGTLWATHNVGASRPTDFGDYFAWGETEPKEVYDWIIYKYAISHGEDLDSITKYNMSGYYGGTIDSLSELLPEDDAATANWGKEWRIPTNEEQRELYENSYMVWMDGYNGTDVNGVIFYKAKKKSDKGKYHSKYAGKPSSSYSVSSDAHIFLPAAGYLGWNGDLFGVGDFGSFWSSTLDDKREHYARYLTILDSDVNWLNVEARSVGIPVRAVCSKK